MIRFSYLFPLLDHYPIVVKVIDIQFRTQSDLTLIQIDSNIITAAFEVYQLYNVKEGDYIRLSEHHYMRNHLRAFNTRNGRVYDARLITKRD